jgi:choline dehydrogenase
LTIRPGVLADRFELEGDSAVRLVCTTGSGEEHVTAGTFVLAAGTFGSPATLLRSGIGPADELRRLGIDTRLALEGVGANLHDHPGIGIRCDLTPEAADSYQRDLRGDRLYPSQVILRAQSRTCNGPFDLHLLPSQSPLAGGDWSFDLIGFHMRSYSRGAVRLQSTDPSRAPEIDFRFMVGKGEADVPVLSEVVQLLRSIADTEPLRSAIASEVEPGPEVSGEEVMATYVRSAARTYSHCVGTCKMGPSRDPEAVVDRMGRVHGISNLYVADASVIPEIPLANTNLTCFLIGYKMAETLRDSLT